MYSWVAENIFALALDYSRGTRTMSCLRDLETSQWWPQDRILTLQMERLGRLLRHAYDNVSYYRRIFDERGIKPDDIKSGADLSKLPVLDKRIIRRNFDLMKAVNLRAKDFIPLSTSGSTGEPLLFYSTKENHINRGYARSFRSRRWSGWQLGDRMLGFRLRTAPDNIFVKMQNNIIRRLERVWQFSPQEISETTLPYIVRKFEQFKPEFVSGYPSAVYLFARYLENRRKGNPGIKVVMTGGEQLYDYQRELFRKVFNCDTFSYYSTWEVHDIAAECPQHTGHHIAAEDIIVEIVDKSGNPVPAGVEGRILLTNLHNYAMPFIRYDIGDTASLSETTCSCERVGLPLLVNLNGRADAVISTPTGKHIPGRALPGGRFFAGLGIVQYQIVQERLEELVFYLVLDSDCHPATQESITRDIEAKYHSLLGPNMTLKIHFVDQIPLDKSGKRSVVISKLSRES